MVETLGAIVACPLCGAEIHFDLCGSDFPDRLAPRDKWMQLAAEFNSSRSLERAAGVAGVDQEIALETLIFMCKEICGCRNVTCITCFDDGRSEL